MKSKIAYFVHSYPPAKGGLEELVKIIRNKSSYDSIVITGKGTSLDSYKNFKNLSLKSTKNIKRLKTQIIKQKIFNKLIYRTLFINPYFSPYYFGPNLKYEKTHIELIKKSSILVGTGLPTKMVIDACNFSKHYSKKLIIIPAYHTKKYYNNKLFLKTFKYASKIICLTNFEKNKLLDNYDIDHKKIEVITFCPFKIKNIVKNKNKLKSISKKIKLGYIGQISARKNLDLIYKFLCNSQKTYNFTFAGAKTNDSDNIKKKFMSLKNHEIRFIYNFKEREKKHLFQNIDILINPSVEESLGLVNFESIYYHTPVIINKKSAFNDILNFSKYLIGKPEDITKNINYISSHYQKTQQKQYNIFKKYNIDKAIKRYDDLLSNILKKI